MSAAPSQSERRRPTADELLEGIELVIFDKDGTLIEFARMWRDWVGELGERLGQATGLDVVDQVFALMGVDPVSGAIQPHGLLAATPMARLRELVVDAVEDEGLPRRRAERAVAAAWHAPDPVALATPVTDLPALLDRLAARGIRSAVATSDDRGPTERTLAALDVASRMAAVACADDGHAVKPAPDSVHRISARVGVPVDRILVIGDAPADLRMGRAAGVRRTVGVLTGVGDEATLEPLADAILDSIAGLSPGPDLA